MAKRDSSARSATADRYEKAATDALKMLDWCIWYFRYENQGGVAEGLERNRAYIRKRLTGGPEHAPAPKKRRGPKVDVPAPRPLRKMLEAIGLKPKPQN